MAEQESSNELNQTLILTGGKIAIDAPATAMSVWAERTNVEPAGLGVLKTVNGGFLRLLAFPEYAAAARQGTVPFVNTVLATEVDLAATSEATEFIVGSLLGISIAPEIAIPVGLLLGAGVGVAATIATKTLLYDAYPDPYWSPSPILAPTETNPFSTEILQGPTPNPNADTIIDPIWQLGIAGGGQQQSSAAQGSPISGSDVVALYDNGLIDGHTGSFGAGSDSPLSQPIQDSSLVDGNAQSGGPGIVTVGGAAQSSASNPSSDYNSGSFGVGSGSNYIDNSSITPTLNGDGSVSEPNYGSDNGAYSYTGWTNSSTSPNSSGSPDARGGSSNGGLPPGYTYSGPVTDGGGYHYSGDSTGAASFGSSPSPNSSGSPDARDGSSNGGLPPGYSYSGPISGGTPTTNSSGSPDYRNGGSSGGSRYGSPVVLDLTGNGIHLTQESASNMFFDMAGDGLQHRTAWAAAGDGVLVLDLNNSGVINRKDQVDFTAWDPTATSDMQALLDVFDTNHDGELDSGDTDWSSFKVMVSNVDGTTSLVTLASLGITSINLTTNNQVSVLSDGSHIKGETTYTKAGGSTGIAADVSLNYDANGYVITSNVTHNADGSTTTDNKASNTDGSVANETVSTISASGLSKTTSFDDNGDGVADRMQTDVTVVNADSSTTETVSDFNGAGTILSYRQMTTTSSDKKTVTIDVDSIGSGTFDQSETTVTAADGSQTVTADDLTRNGTIHDHTVTSTSGDGLTKTVQFWATPSGALNSTTTDDIVVSGTGVRTETITSYAGNSIASANEVSEQAKTTSADGSSKTVATDLDGNGTTDLTTTSSIVHNSDGSTTTTVSDTNGNGSLRDKTVTQLSGSGLIRNTTEDLDGNGTSDRTVVDTKTLNSDGSTTETITTNAGNGTKLGQTTETWSADGKTRTSEVDDTGSGTYDQIDTVALVGTNRVDTASIYGPSGTSLVSKTVTTTSSNGLSETIQRDVNGDGTFDAVETITTTHNADGSSTVTDVTDNGAGTIQIGKTVVTTSANGLTKTTAGYLDNQTAAASTVTDAKVLNGDQSTTETVTTLLGTTQVGKTVTTVSADRSTTTTKTYVDGNSMPELVDTAVTNSDGSKVETRSVYSANGATLLSQTTITTSADGLTTTTSMDADGNGTLDTTTVAATSLNSDGSTTVTTTQYAGGSTTAANETLESVVTTSGNGLSVTTLVDDDGNGSFDSKITDVTVLNADGSRTETVTSFNGAGTSVIRKTVTTISGNGLSKTVAQYVDGSTTAYQTVTDVTVLNSDGSKVETVSTFSSSGALIAKQTTTTSGNGTSVVVARDLDGNGVNDQIISTTRNADGSTTVVTSTYNTTGTLTSKSTESFGAGGLSVTTATDLDGNATTDKSESDVTVLNSDGSRTETVSDFTGTSTLLDKTVITTSADGLSVTRQWDDTGAGSFAYSRTDVTTVNADGSTTEVVSDLNANGSLHDKTTTAISADKLSTTVTRDLNGDGVVDQTFVTTHNPDGSTSVSDMDGTVNSASGRLYGATNGTYETISANGLSKTFYYDATGDGLAEKERSDVTTLNTDGSRTETLTDYGLTGGSPTSANPVYTATETDREVVTTSTNGLSKTTQWDLTGAGSFTETQTDVTVFNADGSKTETVSLSSGGTLKSRKAVTVSADGLTVTTQVDPTGSGTFTEAVTKATVVNADGSQTITTTSASLGGGELSSTTETISADGRTETFLEDPTGWGNVTQSQVDNFQTLADGSTVEATSDYYGNLSTLKDKITTSTSADGRTVTISRDANGDGITDQTETDRKYVDGSSLSTITDLTSSGAVADKTTIAVSADGLTTTTQRDLNGNGINDRSTTDTRAINADGSTKETVQTYQTSHLVSGVETSESPVLIKSATITTSADGRTKTISTDVDGNGSIDQTSTTVVKLDGASATTVTNNTASRNVAPIPGHVLWSSSLVSTDKTVAASVITTTSTDGLSRTVQSDYDGNGTYEHTEIWQVAADGSQYATITDVNSSGTAIARGYETISADGLITTLYVDPTASGQITHKDSAVTRADGSIVETVTNLNSDGTLNQRVVSTVSANGQTVSPTTTNGPGTSWTITASNTTPNEYGIDGKATVSGTGNIISFGNAVDVAVLNGNTNTIDETGAAFVTVSGTGTGTQLHAINRDNVASISSATLEIENYSSLTLEGSSDTITAFDNADLTLWSGTSDTLQVNGSGDIATMSGSTVQLWNGSSLTLTGNTDTITVYNNTTLDIASGIGDTLYVNGNGDAATLSSATIQLWNGSDLTLTGTGDAVTLFNNTNLTSTAGNTIEVDGTGVQVTVVGGGGNVTLDANQSATVFNSNNTVSLGSNATLVLTGGGDIVNANSTGGYVQVSNGTINISASGEASVDGTGDSILMAANGQVTVMQAGDTVNETGANGYAQIFSGTVNIAASSYSAVDGTGDVVNLVNSSSTYELQSGDTVNDNGTSAFANISSGTVNVGANAEMSMDGTGNTITMGANGQITVNDSGNTVNVSSTGGYAMISSGTVNVSANGEISVDGTSDTVNMASNSQATIMQNGDTVNSNGTSVYAMISNGTVNIGAGDQASIDGTGNTVNFGHSSRAYGIQGSNTFVFAQNFGIDSIAGYVASGSTADTIDVSHTMFADWAHLLAGASQSGSDVIITADANDSITLKNTTLASLQQSQFHFT